MTPNPSFSRRALLSFAGVPAASAMLLSVSALTQTAVAGDPLPSWNDGLGKQAMLDFVRVTTDPASPKFVPPESRIATFDQDGTLWVEHPIYSQLVYCFDRVPAVVKEKPGFANVEPFKTVLSGPSVAAAISSKSRSESFAIASRSPPASCAARLGEK
jgi:hypothetical protein